MIFYSNTNAIRFSGFFFRNTDLNIRAATEVTHAVIPYMIAK